MGKSKPVCEYAPKRPLSGYFLFAADVRSKIVAENEDMPVTHVMAEIGKRWANLPDSGKAPYNDKAAAAKEVYQKKLEKYQQTAHYTKHQAKLAEWKKQQKKKPFKKDPNKPKKGLSAYLIFVNEKRPELTKQGLKMLEISKEAGSLWAKLSEEDKAPYVKKADKFKKEADAAMEKYRNSSNYKQYMKEKAAWDSKRAKA